MKIKYSWLKKRRQLANIDVWKLKRAGKNVRKNSSEKIRQKKNEIRNLFDR